jgi:dephospho-CoA kinase
VEQLQQWKRSKVRRVALTGGIATGKSHVRAHFDALGVPTIDSDLLAREAVAPGTPGLAAIVERFGGQVVDASGSLDRRKLGSIVFADPAARLDLEAIVHPFVREATERWFRSLDGGGHPFAIADIPLLYEVGRDGDFDAVIVAACEPETQLRRVMARDGVTDAEARQRIAAQIPIQEKIARAGYVIRTDGAFDETERQVREVHAALAAGS